MEEWSFKSLENNLSTSLFIARKCLSKFFNFLRCMDIC